MTHLLFTGLHYCSSYPCPVCQPWQVIIRPFMEDTGRYRRFPWVLTADGPVRFP